MREVTAMGVLLSLRPTATFGLDGSDVIWDIDDKGDIVASNLHWQSTAVSIPTKEEFETEYARLQELYITTTYQRQRAPEYPPLVDFIDASYWQTKGDNTKMLAYLAAVDAVKSKYPKE